MVGREVPRTPENPQQHPCIRPPSRAPGPNGGIRLLVTVLDDDYPPNLRLIPNLPPFIFYRGSLGEKDALSAAVLIIFTVLTLVGYPVIFETATRGRSLGKMALGLRVLNLGGCGQVTGAGLARLRGLTGLRLLDVRGCGVKRGVVARLRAALPGCRVVQ